MTRLYTHKKALVRIAYKERAGFDRLSQRASRTDNTNHAPHSGATLATLENPHIQKPDFKDMSRETGVPYQNLIDSDLADCADKKRKLRMKWG